MNIIRKEALQTSHWPGGSTTQLYIFPENASYAERNFQVRISTATIETSPSNFTPLPGFNRLLMALKGSLNINFGIHGKAFLKPFEQVAFSGDWETSSKGIGIDFNVMSTEKASTQLTAQSLTAGASYEHASTSVSILYLYQGMLLLKDGTSLNAGDVCKLENSSTPFTAKEPSILICTNIAFD